MGGLPFRGRLPPVHPVRRFEVMVRPAVDVAQLAQLTVDERLDQLALVAERRAEHARDPEDAIPWEVVRAELEADQLADERAQEQAREG